MGPFNILLTSTFIMVRLISIILMACAASLSAAEDPDTADVPVCGQMTMITLLAQATGEMNDLGLAGQITSSCMGLIGAHIPSTTPEKICSCFGSIPKEAVEANRDQLNCRGDESAPDTIYTTWTNCGSGTGQITAEGLKMGSGASSDDATPSNATA